MDGTQVQSTTSIDNDTRRVDRVKLGPSNLDAGTSGTYYFDAFRVVILSFLAIWAFTSQDANRWTRAGGVVIVGIYFVWFFIAILKGAAWCAPFQFVFQS